jgi:hypothetical protein
MAILGGLTVIPLLFVNPLSDFSALLLVRGGT